MEIAFDKVTILASSDPTFSVDTFLRVKMNEISY